MLRDAGRFVVKQSAQALVIGRSRARLDSVTSGLGSSTGVECDYRDELALERVLGDAVKRGGSFDLALLWIHDPVSEVLERVVPFMGAPERPGRVVLVESSAVAMPGGDDARYRELVVSSKRRFSEVVLGFVIEESGARWLTHREICDGVIEVIRSGEERAVVGVVEPWSARP